MIDEKKAKEITFMVKDHCRHLLGSFYGDLDNPTEDQQKVVALCTVLASQSIEVAMVRLVKELSCMPDQLAVLTKPKAEDIGNAIAAELMEEWADALWDEPYLKTMQGGEA